MMLCLRPFGETAPYPPIVRVIGPGDQVREVAVLMADAGPHRVRVRLDIAGLAAQLSRPLLGNPYAARYVIVRHWAEIERMAQQAYRPPCPAIVLDSNGMLRCTGTAAGSA
jgi:hypothetical protein